MELVVRVVGVANIKGRGRFQAQVVRRSRHGKNHADMQRVYDLVRYDMPPHGLSLTENTITFVVPLTRLDRATVQRCRKAIDTAMDAQLV